MIAAPSETGARRNAAGFSKGRPYNMNLAFFLKPKSEVLFLYDDMPMPEALNAFHNGGFSSVPVISREGLYVNTISAGDFLWSLAQSDGEHLLLTQSGAAETKCLRDVLRQDRNPPCFIDMPVAELLLRTMEQNFVPVVDDRGVFIGIVTRRAVLDYFLSRAIGAQN